MARSLWSGSLSFGLVNVPVTVHSAVRDRDVHFRQLHSKDQAPIETRRVCAQEGVEVPWEDVAHGYELKPGQWVLLSDDELAAAQPQRTRTIDIEQFVPMAAIDPLYFDHPYLLVPAGGEGGARAYHLLREVMQDCERAAIGRFVLRAREYVVAVRAVDRALSLTTMLFADEARSAAEVARGLKGSAPTRRQVDNAVALIEELTVPFDPAHYKDEHRARLRRLIKRREKGESVAAPDEAQPEPATAAADLMAALEHSLAQVRGGRGGGPQPQRARRAKART